MRRHRFYERLTVTEWIMIGFMVACLATAIVKDVRYLLGYP